MAKDKESHKARVEDLRRRIDTLRCSHPVVVGEIDQLKARKADLMKELRLIGDAIIVEETKLAKLLNSIDGLHKTREIAVCSATQSAPQEYPADSWFCRH
jgi:hypothetical protein